MRKNCFPTPLAYVLHQSFVKSVYNSWCSESSEHRAFISEAPAWATAHTWCVFLKMWEFSKYSQALVQGKKQEEMSKSCWLIFEHTQLLGRPAGNVGWENSFTSDNVFLSHGNLPSSIFPVYTSIQSPAAFTKDFHQSHYNSFKRGFSLLVSPKFVAIDALFALLLFWSHRWLLTSYYLILSHSPSHLLSSHRLFNIHLIFAFKLFSLLSYFLISCG